MLGGLPGSFTFDAGCDTPQASGPNDLYVASVDSAGNWSAQRIHHFYVAPT